MTTLKYGLMAPLRRFDIPTEWSGKQTIIVTNAEQGGEPVIRKNNYLGTQHEGTTYCYTIPANAQGEVHINRTINGNCASNITIHVGTNANVKIIETINGSGSLASSTFVAVGRDATVQYAILQDTTTESLCMLNYEAAASHAQLHWFFCGIGGDTTQVHINTDAGDRATVINNAAVVGTGTQQFDVHVSTNHIGSYTRSDMLTRSVLDDEARAIYHGLIHIGQDAPECDSYQKDEVILLGDRASADAIPNLEIQNNKVRCSHGATIGRLDEEKLFYFRSRGIEKEEAKRMIMQGFLETLFIAPWQEKLANKL
jgi:Fe-S cluster assembly protein SufD